MSTTDLSKLNFNLIKALDALLKEQNVSKAGAKINITQSAMSLCLKQLRRIYQDDLLVRGQQSKMTLTAFAKTLIKPVQQALRDMEAVFASRLYFDPCTTEKTFHIGMPDYVAFVILPKLMQVLEKTAPGIKIVQHAINYLDSSIPFEHFSLDLAIGDFPKAPNTLKAITLFRDRGIIVACKKHPAMQSKILTLKSFLKYPQVFVALESQPEENFIINMLEKMGIDVKVRLITPHTLIPLQTLPNTLLMTNTVERLALPFVKPLCLAIRPTPYKLPEYHARMYWHARDHNEPSHKWLRELIKEILKEHLYIE